MMRFLLTGVLVLIALSLPSGRSHGQEPPFPIEVIRDFYADFDPALAANTLSTTSIMSETIRGKALTSIFLHPMGAEDAVLAYPDVAVPELGTEQGCFLLFHLGIRDDIPWDHPARKPNGVRFSVRVDEETVFEEAMAESGWRSRAVDMAPWAGRAVRIEFRTNAIDGDSSYDWALFGMPLLTRVTPTDTADNLPAGASGAAILRVECAEPSTITAWLGETSERAVLDAGTHLLAVMFAEAGPVRLEIDEGAASMTTVLMGLFAPCIEVVETTLSSPLVTVDRPFNILRTIRNTGRGDYLGGEMSLGEAVDADIAALGPQAAGGVTIPRIGPGEEHTLRWDALTAPAPGDWRIRHDDAGELAFHVFPPEPAPPASHAAQVEISVFRQGESLRAVAGNAWSRLCLVVAPSERAYAVAQTWTGSRWQRVATLYPLAGLTVRRPDGATERLALRVHNVHHAEPGSLVIYGTAQPDEGKPWPVLIVYSPDPDSPRIHMDFEAIAPEDAELLAFEGPTLLAGDRAFGARKEFAIFPGLEYLEGDEESSSTRDLAPPLHDRRVPAIYKIAAPLMAVQAQDALVALLWDARHEWAAGHAFPAARFMAPKFASGMDHIHMSLFAPSVGDYVRENTYLAETPFALKQEQRLHLSAWVVLDHATRHPADSVARSPHRGGLVLQAMQHWFDVFGLPEPSPPPRDWEKAKELSRHAYMNAVWSEDPPGWRHCYGWDPGPFIGHAVPLLLDMHEGVGPDTRAELERRIGRVANRVIREQGKGALWTSAGCHIMQGEFPFYYGYVGESMAAYRASAMGLANARENGIWVWKPAAEKYATLGVAGDHTLGQAAGPSLRMLRAGRMTGDPALIASALEAMKQMELYEVPRGAQMWECPLYQPDILASGQAVRAYCEAYRLTGDPAHLVQARYWAWTGLPFLYLWEMDDYPTMRYNVIAVMGSTFHTHSWIGLPVVWCGLVYAYGLLDLAEFDDSFPWRTVAQGIVHSAMWQQYTDGPNKGCYPDSWNMVRNAPVPADINPENIMVNGFRIRGLSPEIKMARFEDADGPDLFLNSAATITDASGSPGEGRVRFTLREIQNFTIHSMLSPIPEPLSVAGAAERVADSDALRSVASGWLYDAELRAVILKHRMERPTVTCEIRWADPEAEAPAP